MKISYGAWVHGRAGHPLRFVPSLQRAGAPVFFSLFLITCACGLLIPAGASELQPLTFSSGPLSESGGADSHCPILSPDARFVLFTSTALNLAAGASNQVMLPEIPPKLNVYLRDRELHSTALVSASTNGAGANDDCFPLAFSPDGRYALFESAASNLVPSDTNKTTDLFVRDLQAKITLLASANTNGLPANGASSDGVITPDGRFVAFVSAATDLVPGDTNRIPDIFVRDLQSEATVLASVGARSTNATFYREASISPSISDDGRFVAFVSSAWYLLPNLRLAPDVYVRDLQANTSYWASAEARALLKSYSGVSNAFCFNPSISADGSTVLFAASIGQYGATTGIVVRFDVPTGTSQLVCTNVASPFAMHEEMVSFRAAADAQSIAYVALSNSLYGTGSATGIRAWNAATGATVPVSGDATPVGTFCQWPAISADGTRVSFASSLTGLVANPITDGWHLYCRDLVAGVTHLVDADTNGIGTGVSPEVQPRISADGRFVAFESVSDSLVPNDRNRCADVFLRDLLYGTNELISVRRAVMPSLSGNAASAITRKAVSDDGRFVVFRSAADNFVPDDTNLCSDVFLRDRQDNSLLLVSRSTNGTPGSGPSMDAVVSSSGRYVAFTSHAEDLVPGDTNRVSDVFLFDRETGVLKTASRTSDGVFGRYDSFGPVISPDGRFVVFRGKSQNLAPVVAGDYEYGFLFDAQSGAITALTRYWFVDAAFSADGQTLAVCGAPGSTSTAVVLWDMASVQPVYTNTVSTSGVWISPEGSKVAWIVDGGGLNIFDTRYRTNWLVGPAWFTRRMELNFSADARYLVFLSANSLAPEDTNAFADVYVLDLQTGLRELVSRSLDGSAPNGASYMPDISSDGRFFAYCSEAGNIVPDDTNGEPDLFLFDRQTRATTLVSANRDGAGTAQRRSSWPRFSRDKQTLLFQSTAADLTGADFNNTADIFALPLFYLTILHDGQHPELQWPAMSKGHTYTVQYKDSIGAPDWQTLSLPPTNTGHKMWLRDSSAPQTRRFYRVLLD